MKRLPKRSVFLVAALVAVISLGSGACTTETNGQPTPGGASSATARPTIPGGGGGPASATSGTKPQPSDSPVYNIDPCTLLTSAEMSTLKVAEGQREKDTSAGDSKACQWLNSGQFTIQASTFDTRGIKDVVATGEIKPVPTVGKHQAVQSIYGTTCGISIGITETSRVDVSAAANGDTPKSCEIAMQVARLVEPKLPGGS